MKKILDFFRRWYYWIIPGFIAIFLFCLVLILPECEHKLVYCDDTKHCSEAWHLHEARCENCHELIGRFTTEEMVKWNGVDKK